MLEGIIDRVVWILTKQQGTIFHVYFVDLLHTFHSLLFRSNRVTPVFIKFKHCILCKKTIIFNHNLCISYLSISIKKSWLHRCSVLTGFTRAMRKLVAILNSWKKNKMSLVIETVRIRYKSDCIRSLTTCIQCDYILEIFNLEENWLDVF